MPTKLDSLLRANPELNIPVHNFNINVTSNLGEVVSPKDVLSMFSDFAGRDEASHVYFHIPLCNYICHYCNYVKRKVAEKARPDEIRMWADLLVAEMRSYRRFPWLSDTPVSSMYIGGGTGALLLNDRGALDSLTRGFEECFQALPDCERTLEGNPENFTKASVDVALRLGFNRFSVGVQSLEDRVNSFTNRGHNADEALRAIEVLLGTGVPFSVDMMFGLPFQTPETVEQDIRTLIGFGVPTISLYRLRNVDREKMGIGNASVWNVPINRSRLDSEGVLPDVFVTYRMRDRITHVLREHDYLPSPCGWWNRQNTYPDGNIPRVSRDKWQRYSNMFAFGPGAYGWLTGQGSEVLQTHNVTDIKVYVEQIKAQQDLPPLSYGRHLAGQTAMGTRLSFAFKANQPLLLDEYEARFGLKLLEHEPYATVFMTLIQKGLMRETMDGRALIPTAEGEELHEEIMFHYFHEAIGSSSLAQCQRSAATS